MVRIVIQGDPRTKKNSEKIHINRKTKKPFVTPSDAYKLYESNAAWQIWQQWRNVTPIEDRVNVKCLFYMQTRRVVDLPNLLNSVDDILVRFRVLRDDNSRIVAGHDGSRVLYDKDNPRVEIEITEMKENA